MPHQLADGIRGPLQQSLLALKNETISSLRIVLNTRPVSGHYQNCARNFQSLSCVCFHSTSLHEKILFHTLLINYYDIFRNKVAEIIILSFVCISQSFHHCYVLSPLQILLIFSSLEKGQSLEGH